MKIPNQANYRLTLLPALAALLASSMLSAGCSEQAAVEGESTAHSEMTATATPDEAMALMHLIDARINAPAPGQSMSAGYFTLMNHGQEPVTLVSIESATANIQMHTTKVENGGTTMRPLDAITIAPNDQIVFQPGGNHLMIRNVPIDAKSLALTMNFADGATLDTSFYLVPLTDWMNHDGH